VCLCDIRTYRTRKGTQTTLLSCYINRMSIDVSYIYRDRIYIWIYIIYTYILYIHTYIHIYRTRKGLQSCRSSGPRIMVVLRRVLYVYIMYIICTKLVLST
jgi:hypothetical protein